MRDVPCGSAEEEEEEKEEEVRFRSRRRVESEANFASRIVCAGVVRVVVVRECREVGREVRVGSWVRWVRVREGEGEEAVGRRM